MIISANLPKKSRRAKPLKPPEFLRGSVRKGINFINDRQLGANIHVPRGRENQGLFSSSRLKIGFVYASLGHFTEKFLGG